MNKKTLIIFLFISYLFSFIANANEYDAELVFQKKEIIIKNGKLIENVRNEIKINNREYLPEPKSETNTYVSLNYLILQNEDEISVTLDYYSKKSVYPAKAYTFMKVFFNNIVKKGNERIVLRKVN